jgi:site-specific DNA recombinase
LKNERKPVLDAVPIGARAVGYVRVAAVPQSDPRSGLDTQAASIRAFAAAVGIEMVRIFEDAGESAHNTWRPGLLALLAAVDSGHVTVIIVPDLTRLARDAGDLLHLIDSFARRGVSLVSATEPWGV